MIIGLPAYVGEYAFTPAATGIPPIMCRPLILDLAVQPLTIDWFVEPLFIEPPDTLDMDLTVAPLAIDLFVEPLTLDCD